MTWPAASLPASRPAGPCLRQARRGLSPAASPLCQARPPVEENLRIEAQGELLSREEIGLCGLRRKKRGRSTKGSSTATNLKQRWFQVYSTGQLAGASTDALRAGSKCGRLGARLARMHPLAVEGVACC